MFSPRQGEQANQTAVPWTEEENKRKAELWKLIREILFKMAQMTLLGTVSIINLYE